VPSIPVGRECEEGEYRLGIAITSRGSEDPQCIRNDQLTEKDRKDHKKVKPILPDGNDGVAEDCIF
jgi:hypothetical protein